MPMFWQDTEQEPQPQVPDDIIDVMFPIRCRSLPVDHAHALSQAVLRAAPWLAQAPHAAVQTIHVAGS